MDGEDRDRRTVHRGIDEAYACQDVLTPVPVQSSRFFRVVARIGGALREAGSRIFRTQAIRRRPPESLTETIR